MDLVSKEFRDFMMYSINNTVQLDLIALEGSGLSREKILDAVVRIEDKIVEEIGKISEKNDDHVNLSALIGMIVFYNHMKAHEIFMNEVCKKHGVSLETLEHEMSVQQESDIRKMLNMK